MYRGNSIVLHLKIFLEELSILLYAFQLFYTHTYVGTPPWNKQFAASDSNGWATSEVSPSSILDGKCNFMKILKF